MAAAPSGPKYKLSSFQHVIRTLPEPDLKIPATRATDKIMALLECEAPAAREYIRDAVLALGRADYAGTIPTSSGVPADVYGIMRDGVGLYIKLTVIPKGKVTKENHLIMSCHPADSDVHTMRGVVPRHRPPTR